jgi:hypothetical protein
MSGRVLVSVFKTEDDVIKATAAARKEGLEIVDVYAPYAIHGLDRAMGLPPSRLPWVTFVLGAFGGLSMAIFQYWASAVSWPINVGGKPWHSWLAFAPVIFEVTVLLGGVGTVLFFIVYSGLKPGAESPVSDLRVTDDRFALVLAQSGRLGRPGIESLLSRFHPVSIEERTIDVVARRAV